MSESERGLHQAWWALKIGLGATAFLAGLDKFVGILADWSMYLSPTVEALLPLSPQAFMQVVGVVEMLAGLLVLSRYTRIGAYVVAAWLVAIAVQLLTSGMFYDLAVRDVVLAVAAFALARLSEWRSVRPARAGA